jgi:hypothetical protein
MKILCASGLIASALLIANAAHAAPAGLLNKTVSVSYSVTATGTKADGTPVTGSRVAMRTLYISGAGRVFARAFRRDGRASQTREAGPEETGNNLHFVGDKLVGVMKFASGAAQMTISFDSSGQSCSANIVSGREGGRALQWKGVDGAMRTASGPLTFSGISCSIAAGNAFGGGQ